MALETGPQKYFLCLTDVSQMMSDKSFTLEMWIKPAGAGVILNEVDAWDVAAWDYSLAEVTPQGDIVIGLPGITGTAIVGRIPLNAWSHLTLRYNVATRRYDALINGVAGGEFLTGTRRLPSEGGRLAYWAFGRSAARNLGNGGWLTGEFDEIRLWRVARPDVDITATWRLSFLGGAEAMLFNWHLDEASGTGIGDASGGNRGGLTSGAVRTASGVAFGAAPLVTSVRHASIDWKTVRLSADVDPNDAETTAYFEYGPTVAYGGGSEVVNITSERRIVPVTTIIGNLSPGHYNYRLVASNRFGANISQNASFQIVGPAHNAVNLAGAGYVRTSLAADPDFRTDAFTYELWFQSEGPGTIITEVDRLSELGWDVSLLEVRGDGRLVAFVPGLPPIVGPEIVNGRWHHAALRYDDVSDALDLIVDGVKVGSSSGVRVTPWSLGRSTYIAFGRRTHLGNVQGRELALTYATGTGRIAFAAGGNRYVLTQTGQPEERGTFSAHWESPAPGLGREGIIITLFDENGTSHRMEIAFNNETAGEFVLREPPGDSSVTGGTFTSPAISPGAFRGKLDEIRLWREALTDQEMAANRTLRISHADPRLHAMWSLDFIEGFAHGWPSSPDRSPTGNPAVLVGEVTLTESGATLSEDPRPLAQTGAAAAGAMTVMLNGSANSASPGIAFFRWGLGDDLSNTTTAVAVGNGVATGVQAELQNLQSAAEYSYVLVVSNQFGISAGLVRKFTAPDLSPIATTGTFTDSPGTSVIIRGTANTLLPGEAYFIWGEQKFERSTRPVSVAPGAAAPMEAVLDNLEAGKTYRFALVVRNEVGTRTGVTRTFVKAGWGGSSVLLLSSSHVRSANDQRPFFTDETITVELWIKPRKAGVVFAEVDRTTPSALDSSIIEVLSSGTVVAGFPGVPTVTIGALALQEWSHVAVRYDKATQRLDGWVNGIKSINSSTGDRVAGWELGRQIIYTFGKSTTGRIGTGEHMDGEFDEIRLWSVARTDAEIEANFARKLFGTEAGMVAYYRFDERTNAVTDHSRHNNNATVTGFGSSFVASGAGVSVDFNRIGVMQTGELRMQFTGVPGREVRLRHTSDLDLPWTDGPTAIVDSLGIATFTVPREEAARARFYIGESL